MATEKIKILVSLAIKAFDLGDEGEAAGYEATCSRCQFKALARGTGYRSRKYCMMMMRLKCPRKEVNNYHWENDSDGETTEE